MGNLFAIKPDLPELRQRQLWKCPVTGIVLPKDPVENLQWRAEVLKQAEHDTDLQVNLYTACSQSLLFFVNAFAFTLVLKGVDEDGLSTQAENKHVPYVTWPIQDEHLLWIEKHITEGVDGLTDKSRDMGATWDHIAVMAHRFIFKKDESHLVLSRKEECVDMLGGLPKNYPHGILANPGTLFGKLDYILSRLPEWMLPAMNRKSMHIVNLDAQNRIDGESSNATAGSADRRTSIFLDEMAKMKEGAAIKQSTKDVTACRLACSTPWGPGTAFSKWRMSGQVDVFTLPWWEHPEKGFGRYVAVDELGRFRIRSPFYDQRCKDDDPKEVAVELDMDHIGSGDIYFDATVIETLKKICGREPRTCMTITMKKKGVADDMVTTALRTRSLKHHIYGNSGPWKLWCQLVKNRPDQNKSYTIAVDISKGQGASNSVINISCNETREKIAEFADANTPPYELARLCCAAALWCGGRGGLPLVIWENNGDPGKDFEHQFVHTFHYPRVYFDKQAGTLRQKIGKRYGFRSSTEKKATALGVLRQAYSTGRYINRSVASLNEALTYIHYENGGIGPATLVAESDSTRKAHGDRVIADMLITWTWDGKPMKPGKEVMTYNPHSIGGRMNAFKRRNKDAKSEKRFNFEAELV